MEQETQTQRVNYQLVLKEIWKRRKLYFIGLPIVFILSCLYIICIPRTYTSETKMAPEVDSPTSGGALGSIASSFGFDLSIILYKLTAITGINKIKFGFICFLIS